VGTNGSFLYLNGGKGEAFTNGSGLFDRERSRIYEFLCRSIGTEEVPPPTTNVTIRDDRVVWMGAGVPSVSKLSR
jgi:hypothetical protein